MQAMLREQEERGKTAKIVMDELIKDVLKGWGDWAVRFDGKPAMGPAPMDMELAVLISGSMQGVLVLRGPSGLGRALSLARGADDVNADPTGAFREFSGQVARRLLDTLMRQNHLPMVATAPVNSSHQNWPAGRPRLALALLVDGIPLEVRLWLKGPHDSAESAELHLDSSSRRSAQRVRARQIAQPWA